MTLVAVQPQASAHRLDELLQATRIGIEASHIDVQVELTPGADIAASFINSTDSNRDGRLEDAELNGLMRHLEADLRLTRDDRTVPLHFARYQMASVEELRQGVGSIRVFATAVVEPDARRHRLTFANGFAPAPSAFLVNALTPAEGRVHLGQPTRDPQQRTFAIDYEVTRPRRVVWIAVAVAVIGILLRARRRGKD